MKCSKCGFELKEDEKFCGNCGASISEEISAEPSVSEEVSADEAVSEAEVTVPSKKKSKLSKALIVLAAVVVVLGACFFAFKDAIVGRVAFLLPAEKQLQLAFKQAAKDWAEKSGDFVTDASDIEVAPVGTASGDISIAIGDEAKKELEKAANTDLGDVNKIFLEYDGCSKDAQLLYDMTIGIGKTKIMSVNVVMDMEEGVMAITIPELSNKAIEFNMENDMGIDVDEFREAMGQSEEVEELIDDILPSEKLLADIIPRYIAVMVQTIDEVEREKEVVKVEQISQKATALIVKLDDNLLKEVAKVFVQELREDAALEEYIKSAAKAIAEFSDETISDSELEENYNEVLDNLEEELNSMADEEAFQKGVKVVTWVDSKNDIIGIEIEDTLEVMGIKDGNNVARYIEFIEPSNKEKLAKIIVEGQEDKEVFAGEITLYVRGEEVFSVKVDKYQWTDENIDLVASFGITKDMLKAMDMEIPYGDITLKVEMASTGEKANLSMKVIINDKEWVVLETTGEQKKEETVISYPSNKVGIANINEWIATVNAEEVVNNLDESGVLDIVGVQKADLMNLIQQYKNYYGSY